MTTLGEDLRLFLQYDPVIFGMVEMRIHQGLIPQVSRYPAIWYQMAGREDILALNGTRTGISRYSFNVECLGRTGDETFRLTEVVNDRLSGHRGQFGNREVQSVTVDNVDEDYIPQADASDQGISISAFQVTIVTT